MSKRALYISTFLFATLLVTTSYAQKREHHGEQQKIAWQNSVEVMYGVAAGVTIPSVSIEGNNASVSATPGVKIGMMWGVDFGRVNITPELWYSSFKINFDKDSAGLQGAQLKNKSLDMPIVIGVDLTRRLKFEIMPTLSLMCNDELTLQDGDSAEFGNIKSSVGYGVGLSYNFVSKYFISGRYTGQFTKSNQEFYSGYDPYEIKISTIDITIGVRF
ncbi:MAG: outer membrane beta-barrel protein [Rikenellaceae bacterium]